MRRPLALSNWKMAMTVAESLAFVQKLEARAVDLLDDVDIVLCPPFTALWPVARALLESRLQLGGQNIAPTTEPARMGEISASLLADAGCRWVMLGHWEVRRHLGDDDETVNRKVHLALEAGLSPILLIGEARDEESPQEAALSQQLGRVLRGIGSDQIEKMAFVYEPESAIGVARPASSGHVGTGCAFLRDWLCEECGSRVADAVRIVYGGSVAPEHAQRLLAIPDVDGLGATRRGRDPEAFVQIVRQIARAKRAM
jgi:triosephosphate isomerase